LAQAVREELQAALGLDQVAILFFLTIRQQEVVLAGVGQVVQLIHQTPEDRVVAGEVQAALAGLRVIPQALRHRKVIRAVMVMDRVIGKARVVAVRVRLG
jgi:hypothetical protein